MNLNSFLIRKTIKKSLMNANCRRILVMMCFLAMTGCEEDEVATLSSFKTPGALLETAHCVIDGVWKNAAECEQAGVATERAIFVTNLQTGTVSYLPLDASNKFMLVDIDTTVPGFTSMSAVERPISIAASEALMVVTSTVNSDVSIIGLEEKREIAYQSLDKPVKTVRYDAISKRFVAYMLDGTIRSLDIDFDCGKGSKVYADGCHLRKDGLSVSWTEHDHLGGKVNDAINDPVRGLAYVSFADRRYVSVVAYDPALGTCLNGGSYPCEIDRIGVGFGCSDGIDNDGDGKIDSADSKCFSRWDSEGLNSPGVIGVTECNDGIDNNGDGFFDIFDPGCVSSNDASEEMGFQDPVFGTCADGQDNNGDGLADHDDPVCRHVLDDEGDGDAITSVCMDGLDNDGDGAVDAEDEGCFGKGGLTEDGMLAIGRGSLGIDPYGRWLYVLNPQFSELIVVDLDERRTVNTGFENPRHEGIGIPVNRLPLSVTGHVRQKEMYNQGDNRVMLEKAVAYVASSVGTVSEITIHEKYSHYQAEKLVASEERLALQPTDINDESSYIGVMRCLNRICTESDLPKIEFRRRPSIKFYSDTMSLSWTNEQGEPNASIADAIIMSETWRATYEGTLETVTRTNGAFRKAGVFSADNDFCYVGVRPGDHLILADREGVSDSAACSAFNTSVSGVFPNLEWEITEVRASELALKPTGHERDVSSLPTPECFTSALRYDIRASGEWILVAGTSPVNRRARIGDVCVDDLRYFYGQTRFQYNETPQTAFFSLAMPANSASLERDSAFEFTVKSGLSGLNFATGSASTDILVFDVGSEEYLVISEGSANGVFVYNIDTESLIQQM